MKPRVLLLNPPGEEVYIRDYYCSKVSKTDYIYHPIDLLYLSGYLAGDYTVSVLDAIADGLSPSACLELLGAGEYHAIIFLSGAVSWSEDRVFMAEVKAKTGALLLGSGDIFMDPEGELLVQNEFLDGIILDFFNPTITHFLQGNREESVNILYRLERGGIAGSIERAKGYFEVPQPLFKLFTSLRYKYPFARYSSFATVLTDYGCPYKCHFCIMNSLNFRQRTVENVLVELRAYYNADIREIYFADQTFGANKQRLRDLCNSMINENLSLSWICFSRVDLIDEDTLSLMKKAGCHTILFGVESANQEILDRYQKGITLEQIRHAFKLCRQMGIATVGTFILGLPGETEETCRATIKLAQELKCDYASFNVPVPRVGTTFRDEAIQEGWTSDKLEPMCQAYTYPVMGTESLSREKIWRLRNQAIMEFYLKPSYIIRRLLKIRNTYQLKTHIKGIYFMLRGMFK